MTLLVLDEDHVSLFVTKRTLNADHLIYGFTAFEDVMEWASQNPFDVLLVDYNPRDRSEAIRLLEQVSKVAKCSFRPFILTTSRIHSSQSQALLDAGFEKIFLRPLLHIPLMEYLKVTGE